MLLGDCFARVSRETESIGPLIEQVQRNWIESGPLGMCWSAHRSEAIGSMFHVKLEPSDALTNQAQRIVNPELARRGTYCCRGLRVDTACGLIRPTSLHDPGVGATWKSVRPGTLRGFKTCADWSFARAGNWHELRCRSGWGSALPKTRQAWASSNASCGCHLADCVHRVARCERKPIADPVPTIGHTMRYKDRSPEAVIGGRIALGVTSDARTV